MSPQTEILRNYIRENLRNWFKKEKWKRIDTQGNIAGDCGTMPKGKKTQRCLPAAKARSLSKKDRAATSRKKTASSKQFVSNTKAAKVKKESLMDTSIDTYKVADSFTPEEIAKLKSDGKISDEVVNGALELQRAWKKRHPSIEIGNSSMGSELYKKQILQKLYP